jgi:hypothetical protein
VVSPSRSLRKAESPEYVAVKRLGLEAFTPEKVARPRRLDLRFRLVRRGRTLSTSRGRGSVTSQQRAMSPLEARFEKGAQA